VRFGDKLRKWRLAAGLTQAQLAGTIGVAQVTVSEWEVRARLPESDRAPALDRALGLEPGTVAGALGTALDARTEENHSPSQAEIAERLDRVERALASLTDTIAGAIEPLLAFVESGGDPATVSGLSEALGAFVDAHGRPDRRSRTPRGST
jgi:transcriptional regulator with XRE-family HTH domain